MTTTAHLRRGLGGVRRRRATPPTLDAATDDALPAGAAAGERLPDPPGVPRAPLRDRAAALAAPAGRRRPGPGPHDDPARVVHDEAQRGRRDGGRSPGPEFADLHPFAPDADTAGIRELIADLERWLAEMTGYAAVSLQPNAGSQGEFAGLLAIAAYHRSRGEEQRDVCLIPASAHGTNAASAVMAGMRVVVVGTAPTGNVDLADLRAKIDEHGPRLAAMMITYPSTHGVFETEVRAGLRRGARRGRAGLRGRGEPERAGRGGPARGVRRRREPPEPAQDVLHPARRRWAGGRPGRGGRAPGPVPARPHGPRRGRGRPGLGRAVRQPGRAADLLGVPAADGPRRAAPGHPDRDRGGQLRGRPAR